MVGGVGIGLAPRFIVVRSNTATEESAIADEQSIAVGTYLKAVRTRHWIHAIGAGSTALRARESAEVVVRAKARDQVESGGCGAAQSGHISSASVTGEIAEYIDNRRNNIHGGCPSGTVWGHGLAPLPAPATALEP